MIQTHHIHITGIVQGVGFRPHVCRLAARYHVCGTVSNSTDGVHIYLNADAKLAAKFYNELLLHAPVNALISAHRFETIPLQFFEDFRIVESTNNAAPNILVTPDIAICSHCRQELQSPSDKRYHYAFTTCLHCGPRFSITQTLPYDRHNTSMAHLTMCDSCLAEYNNIYNERHFSQTNSCPQCAVPMQLFGKGGKQVAHDPEQAINACLAALKEGETIAVKGIGGYLLLCDAGNAKAIMQLRQRKHRPSKPLAIMYSSVDAASRDLLLAKWHINALNSKAAPIVLCTLKSMHHLAAAELAPGLQSIGCMIAYSPLLVLLANAFVKPLVATSANISGSPIIYKDKDAVHHLLPLAKYVLSFDREIVVPQDDSVLQFTTDGTQVILRRSRGLAPNYFPAPFNPPVALAAIGADLKGSFCIAGKDKTFVSQFLGDQSSFESQESFANTLHHLSHIAGHQPQQVLIDKHPAYFSSLFGQELASQLNIPCTAVQHHKAHFCAVLAENGFAQRIAPVLGFVWDGTGYGDDKMVWGGEIFLFAEGEMNRVAQLQYFPQLMGDKMSREPRLSALALLGDDVKLRQRLLPFFSANDWTFYLQVLQQHSEVYSSSMGRFIDAVSCLVTGCVRNTYEGEAALKMEALASTYRGQAPGVYPLPLSGHNLLHRPFLKALAADADAGMAAAEIAYKVHLSLAHAVYEIAALWQVHTLAFSGGVFQNALLLQLIKDLAPSHMELLFHRNLSPNDECISFGQAAAFCLLNEYKGQYAIKEANDL